MAHILEEPDFRCAVRYEGREVVLYCGALLLADIAEAARILLGVPKSPGEEAYLEYPGEAAFLLDGGEVLDADLDTHLFVGTEIHFR